MEEIESTKILFSVDRSLIPANVETSWKKKCWRFIGDRKCFRVFHKVLFTEHFFRSWEIRCAQFEAFLVR